MLIAEFSHKGEEIEIENELWQYDYGQRIQIKGLDLPETFEVHFAWKDSEKAKVVIGSTVNGISTVDIPNVALEQRRTITAYIYLSGITEGETVNTIILSVNKRKAPENFVTPEDVDLFHHTLAATAEYQRQAKESEKQAAARSADAEAWAHGREDHPDQEQDNAKYYAEQAAASQQAAELSRQMVSDSVTQAQNDIGEAQQQAIKTITEQQGISIQKIKNQTAESEDNLKNTIRAAEQIKTDLDTEVENATPIKQGLDDSNTAAGKTKTALDTSNTTATKTKADLDASNTTASETKTGLDATNKTAAGLVTSLGNKITEGTQVKTDIQTTGETAMSNLQAEATKQQEFIKTSIDDTLSISGKAADAAVTGKKIDSLKEDLADIGSFVGINFETGFVTSVGIENSQTGYRKTKLIPCYEGITITFIASTNNPNVNAISYYDENKNYISGVSNIGTNDKLEYSATAPEGTRFIKVSTTDRNLTNKKWMLSFSESPIVSKMFDDKTSFLSVDYLKADKKIGKNLFNKNSDRIIVGKYLNSVGVLCDNSSYAVSDFMPIEPNTSYVIRDSGRDGAKDVWYADDLKTVVGYSNSDVSISPENAKYLRISFTINSIDKVQVEKGETYTGYEAYTENVDLTNALKNASESLHLATTHEEIFEDSRDIKNYLVWCDLYEGKKYDATGTLNNNSSFTATSITKLDRTRNLYCGVSYTSYVNFYDANKKHIEQKTFYYGSPVLAENFPDNAEYVSFTLYTSSGLLADSPYVYTKYYERNEVRYFRSTIKKYKGTRPVIHVYTSDSEMQIMYKMYDAFLTEDCDVYFENGTYTLSAIYDKFVEWNFNDAKELIIGGNCRYFFNGSTIIADWSSGTAEQMSNASVLGARRKVSSYELHDVTLICNGMTYVVHDETSEAADDYIRRYHNVRMIYNNGIGTNWISKCLGGGTGLNGVCIFENCTFESNAEIDNPAELSYHGVSSEDEGSYSLLISNCYFKHRISLDWLGANQKARLVFNNNSCAVLPSPNESEEANVWNVIVYNNEVHS